MKTVENLGQSDLCVAVAADCICSEGSSSDENGRREFIVVPEPDRRIILHCCSSHEVPAGEGGAGQESFQ